MYATELALPRVGPPLYFIGNTRDQCHYLPEVILKFKNTISTVIYIILLKVFWKFPKVSHQIFSQLAKFQFKWSFFA